jgi:hypothetical protein
MASQYTGCRPALMVDPQAERISGLLPARRRPSCSEAQFQYVSSTASITSRQPGSRRTVAGSICQQIGQVAPEALTFGRPSNRCDHPKLGLACYVTPGTETGRFAGEGSRLLDELVATGSNLSDEHLGYRREAPLRRIRGSSTNWRWRVPQAPRRGGSGGRRGVAAGRFHDLVKDSEVPLTELDIDVPLPPDASVHRMQAGAYLSWTRCNVYIFAAGRTPRAFAEPLISRRR